MPLDRESLSLGGAVRLDIRAAEGDKPARRRFRMVAATGEPLRGQGQYGWDYPVIVALDGIKCAQETPILDNHGPRWNSSAPMRWSVVGQSETAKLEKEGFVLEGNLFDQEQAAKDVIRLAHQGLNWQASIGATSTKKEFFPDGESVNVNGRTHQGPCYVSWETLVREVSFVVIGDDSGTSAVVASGTNIVAKKTFASYCKAHGYGDPDKMDAKMKARVKARFEEDDEDEDDKAQADGQGGLNIAASGASGSGTPQQQSNTTPVTTAPSVISAGQVFREEMDRLTRESAQQAGREAARQQAINRLCASAPALTIETEIGGVKQQVNLHQHALEAGWTAEQTELAILRLDKLRAGRPQGPFGASPHVHIPSTPEASEAVLECALLQAARGAYLLEDPAFYMDEQYKTRRVPAHIERDVRRDLAARYTDQVQQAAHTLYRGRITPQMVLVASGRPNGYRGPEIVRDEGGVEDLLRAQNWRMSRPGQPIQAEGSSTMSIANILANVQNKFMLQGYLFVEQVWRQICGIRPVADFKPTKSINLLGDTEFQIVGPSGELKNAALGDQAFANQADPYGRILTIPWKNLVNDDLSILSTAPMKLGQGAGLALNKLVWATWLNPGNGDDGNAFFSTSRTTTSQSNQVAGNPNKLTAGASSALSSTSLNSAKVLFDNQIDPNGNPLGFDGAKPVLLFPPDLWQTAMELVDPAAVGIVYGGASASRQPNVNLWKGRFEPAMSRYLNKTFTFNAISATGSTTAWYILFNPVALAAIEVCFLNGVDVPTVQQAGPDFQFDRLGISIRGTMPFGVTMQNFRAAVQSPGA
jgi:hypothetical protein